jgi:hypothetical protein
MISMGHFYMNIQFAILYMTYGDIYFYTDYRVAYSLFNSRTKIENIGNIIHPKWHDITDYIIIWH